MAALDDLTWEQLNTTLGEGNAITVSGARVVIDPGKITGKPITDLAEKGVIEMLSKILEAAVRAQTAANEGKSTGERLAAFGNPSYGSVTNGFVTVTQSMAVRVSVNPATQSTIIGTNT